MICVPESEPGAVGDCDPCDGGTECVEDAYCVRARCEPDEVLGLLVECGGPYVAGAAAVQCHAYLDLLASGRVEVTRSAFLTWSEGACTIDDVPCGEDASGDAPDLREGTGAMADRGLFRPAGARDASVVTSDVALVVSARWERGALAFFADAPVVTVPAPSIPRAE